jgi:hypothetical protein
MPATLNRKLESHLGVLLLDGNWFLSKDSD